MLHQNSNSEPNGSELLFYAPAYVKIRTGLRLEGRSDSLSGIAGMEEFAQEHEKIVAPFGKACFPTGMQQGTEKISDGLFHHFEIVQCNEAEYSVDLLVALLRLFWYFILYVIIWNRASLQIGILLSDF